MWAALGGGPDPQPEAPEHHEDPYTRLVDGQRSGGLLRGAAVLDDPRVLRQRTSRGESLHAVVKPCSGLDLVLSWLGNLFFSPSAG